ncbi:GWxTD domain-containing protein [Schleiferia thermophila]|uniref:GWxTD domain-containing protein n=1 Tax=Schleiferia thermophila TaxID=884107 RepID=A0A369AB18_9FLAO|nr:GWxTD domain-containing protein [Schleiferia thermophila]RCX05588.1 GWxTD domain-containing protein [Schleiferia thermophila]GCD78917.1 hypothetical protein JCM30197_01640 [Schleiferia thermophila]
MTKRFFKYLILNVINTLFILNLCGEKLDLRFGYFHFFHPEVNIYTETHFNVYGKSISAIKNESGDYTGSVLITMTFYKDGQVIQGDKIRITLPEVSDLDFYDRGFTAKSQFRLPPGINILALEIMDENNASESYHFELTIDVPNAEDFKVSDLMLIAGIPDNISGNLSKNDFIPYIASNTYLYDNRVKEILFYLEFYDLPVDDEKELPFFVNYYLESFNGNFPMEKFSGRVKIKNTGLHPVFAKIDISSLPSGIYNLVVEAINRKNELYAGKKIRIERISDVEPASVSLDLLEKFTLENTIVPVETLKDSVKDYLLYMMPIVTYSEQKIIDRLLAEGDVEMMMKYFNSYWITKASSGKYWQEYYDRVKIANSNYGTRLIKGFRTDRGRVFCLYGPPTIIESRKHEPNTYPYEIWQYDRLIAYNGSTTQSDRIFIFADREINTGTYRLIHSNAMGENFNERWQYLLMERDMWTPNVDDVDLPAQAGDWGNRFNNSIIINPSKFGRYNRW